MDYEKEYKQLKAGIRKAYLYAQTDSTKAVLETIFPELKENEDEKIRKVLLKMIYDTPNFVCEDICNIPKEKCIAWFEKQGEQKPFDYENANIQQKDFAPKVEPKFKNGQWIVWQDKYYKVNYNGCGYELIDQNGLSTSLEYGTIDENAHFWDITKDAKDGDVLVSRSPFIYGEQCPYGGLDWCTDKFIKASNFIFTDSPVHPATKAQRDALMKAMTDAGYTFDFEKKELKKIEQKPIDKIEPIFEVGDTMRTLQEASNGITSGLPVVVSIDNEYYRCNNETIAIKDQNNYEYPPINKKHDAWSKEDEAILYKVIERLHKYSPGGEEYAVIYYWLKALKDRILPQPRQEWSEEDEKMLNNMDITLFEETSIPNVKYWKFMDWLKSLKQRMNND